MGFADQITVTHHPGLRPRVRRCRSDEPGGEGGGAVGAVGAVGAAGAAGVAGAAGAAGCWPWLCQ